MVISAVKWRHIPMNPNEHSWKATIRTGHRITVPDWIIDDFKLKEGDKLYVTVNRESKPVSAAEYDVINRGG